MSSFLGKITTYSKSSDVNQPHGSMTLRMSLFCVCLGTSIPGVNKHQACELRNNDTAASKSQNDGIRNTRNAINIQRNRKVSSFLISPA